MTASEKFSKIPTFEEFIKEQKRSFLIIGFVMIGCIIGALLLLKAADFITTILISSCIALIQFGGYTSVHKYSLIIKHNNFIALADSVNTKYEFIVNAWKDYSPRSAAEYKLQWDCIIEVAQMMRDRKLITDAAYKVLLENNVRYTENETKIRLENMRNK